MGVNEDFDSVLVEIGDCGLYQFKQYVLIGLAIAFSAASAIGFVFTAAIVPHRCLVRACGDIDETSPFLNTSWLSDAVPFEKDGSPASCSVYENLNSSIDLCSFDKDIQRKCHEWVLDGSERTIQTEFNLMCRENEWKLALVGTLNSLGVLIGLPLSGFISDRFGRKLALIIALISSAVIGLLKTLSTSYEFFVVLEMIEPMFGGNIYGTAFILALEMVSPKRRVLGNTVVVFSYAFGNALVGAIAWGLRGWRELLWAVNGPALLFVLYIWFVPDSVRWLISRGRLADARKIIKSAAKLNKAKINEEIMSDWENGQVGRVDAEQEDKGESLWPSLKQVVGSRTLVIRLGLTSFCWASVTLVYYGLSLNSVALAGTDNKYLNFILSSLIEAPSYLITMQAMTRLGRRKTLCVTFIVSGIACFINPFVPDDIPGIRLPLYLFGKFAITGAFDTTYVFTAEIFPTKLRNSMLGLCSMVGRFGSMLAPQTPLLSQYSKFLPLSLFGAVALVAGTLALFLPETKGLALPTTIKEAEELSHRKGKTQEDANPNETTVMNDLDANHIE